MNPCLLRHVKGLSSSSSRCQLIQCVSRANASSNSVVQNDRIVLDNRKPPPPLDAERMRRHPRIGNREIVGYGLKGKPEYFDTVMFPCPSIRWEADSPQIAELRKKEKADWKALSVDEKKQCKFFTLFERDETIIDASLSVSSEFSTNLRGIHRPDRPVEMGFRMDVDLLSGSHFRL